MPGRGSSSSRGRLEAQSSQLRRLRRAAWRLLLLPVLAALWLPPGRLRDGWVAAAAAGKRVQSPPTGDSSSASDQADGNSSGGGGSDDGGGAGATEEKPDPCGHLPIEEARKCRRERQIKSLKEALEWLEGDGLPPSVDFSVTTATDGSSALWPGEDGGGLRLNMSPMDAVDVAMSSEFPEIPLSPRALLRQQLGPPFSSDDVFVARLESALELLSSSSGRQRRPARAVDPGGEPAVANRPEPANAKGTPSLKGSARAALLPGMPPGSQGGDGPELVVDESAERRSLLRLRRAAGALRQGGTPMEWEASGVGPAVQALEIKEAYALERYQAWSREMVKLREDPTLTAPLGRAAALLGGLADSAKNALARFWQLTSFAHKIF